MDIQKLLSQPESKTLEFKRDLSSLDPILKTIVAFANTAGGILIIGRSSDGTLIGIKDVLKAEEMLANSIADSTYEEIIYSHEKKCWWDCCTFAQRLKEPNNK